MIDKVGLSKWNQTVNQIRKENKSYDSYRKNIKIGV